VKAEGDDDGVTGARAGCAAPAAGSGDETGETALVEGQGAGAAGEGCEAAAGGGLFAAEECALRDVQSDGVTGGMGGVGNNGPAWAAGFSGADVVAGGESILGAAFRRAAEAIAGALVEAAGAELAGARAAACEALAPPRSGVIRFE